MVKVVEGCRPHIYRLSNDAALQEGEHFAIVHAPDSQVRAERLLELLCGLLKVFERALPIRLALIVMGKEQLRPTRLIIWRGAIGEAEDKARLEMLPYRRVVQLTLAIDEHRGRVGKSAAAWVFDTRMTDEIGVEHEPVIDQGGE